MGKVLSLCSEMIFEDVYRKFNQELDLFLSYIPVIKREDVRREFDKILNINTELPNKQTRAERFEESPEGKRFIRKMKRKKKKQLKLEEIKK